MRPDRPLSRWLHPTTLADFEATCLGRLPYARPGVAAHAARWFDWGVLERVLAARPAPDVLVACGGRLAQVSLPRTLDEVHKLMQRGLGVVVRKAERHDALLGELAREVARDLPGEVHVQLYVTPAGTQTFGWHYDREDVFIAQTAGSKDYFMRANSVSDPLDTSPNPDFSAIRAERSPLFTSRLLAGDWLYIPARWWHLVRSIEDALSISIGVLPAPRPSRQGLTAGCASRGTMARGAPS